MKWDEKIELKEMKRLLVLRRGLGFASGVRGFSGGVRKTLEYFAHARTSGLVEARFMMFPTRPWDDLLEGYVEPHEVVTEPGDPDIVLLSREWAEADRLGLTSKPRQFIQLVQFGEHAVPGQEDYLSLARPALRIVVSRKFAERILTFKHLTGEAVVIEAAVSMPRQPLPWSARQWDVTISGWKNPELARATGQLLTAGGRTVRTLEANMPREPYLDQVAAARVLIALPHHPREVAFLTALEGMYLDAAVVLPEVFGTGNYCIDGVSCLTTTYDPQDIARRTLGLLNDPVLIDRLRRGGAEITKRITMENERRSFINVLARVVSGASVPTAANSKAR